MKIQRALHQLSNTEILLELDKERSAYHQDGLSEELKSRNLTEDELAKACKEKEMVANWRAKRSNESLTALEMVLSFLIPFYGSANRDTGPEVSSWEDQGSFLAEAGYKRKLKQRLILGGAGILFYFLLAMVLS